VRLAGLFVALSVSASAHAEEPLWDPGEPTTSRVKGEIVRPRGGVGDGVHGRFEGDLDLGLGLGVTTADGDALGAARLSLHYFSTLGVYGGYADALGRDAAARRIASFGVDLRPLFLLRWSQDAEQGPATLDLFVDSLSLGAGGFLAEPPGRAFGDARGLELSLGAGLPLAGDAAGPWLEGRYLYRWHDPGGDSSGEHALLAVLSWHALFLSALVE